jgi:hypothetical protein
MPPLKKKKPPTKGKPPSNILKEYSEKESLPKKNPMISEHALEMQRIALTQGNTCQ